MYYLLLPEDVPRGQFLASLSERGVMAVSHYVALHTSVAGLRYGRCAGSLRIPPR